MRKFIIILSILFSFISSMFSFSFAKDNVNCSISGIIKDAETKKVLIGVNILLPALKTGDKSDRQGLFSINNLQTGKYKLIISRVGYESKTIFVHTDKANNLNILLQERIFETGEIVVSANKKVQAIQDVPITINIISGDDITKIANTRGEDIVRYIPGVEVQGENISIRGSSGFSFGVGSRVLLMVDGMQMLSADNASMSFNTVPIFAIDHIELIKGAGSALYGSSAIGGIINIITKQNYENKINFSLSSGVYTKPRIKQWEFSDSYQKTNDLQFSLTHDFGKFQTLVSASMFLDDSWRQYDDKNNYSIFASGTYDFNSKNKLKCFVSVADYERADWAYWNSLDSATIPPTERDKDVRIDTRQLVSGLDYYHIAGEDLFINYKTNMFIKDFRTNHDIEDIEYRQSESMSWTNDLLVSKDITENLFWVNGINYTYNKIESVTYDSRNQQNAALYSQIEYKPTPKIIITTGLRGDVEKADTLQANFQFSPKFGLSYKPSHNLNFRFSTGGGFRSPSVAERYAALSYQGFTVIPNLELKPERSYSFEIGGTYIADKFIIPMKIDLSIFDNEMFDLIEPTFKEDGDAVIFFDNVLRARIYGAEFGLSFLLGKFATLESNITYMDPRDIETDELLNYRSQILWYNTLTLNYENFDFAIKYRFKSKIESFDQRLKLEIKNAEAFVDAHIVDCQFTCNLEKYIDYDLRLTLSAENLLDYYYTEMVGNLAMTRRIRLQFSGDL